MLAPETHPQPAYDVLVVRLNRASVHKHFDAYEDVSWEDRANAISADDPRFILETDHPLGATDWYRSLPRAIQSRLGLHLAVCQFKIGIQFERVLQKGLLELADRIEEGRPELRYVYHEVIEESQHSLMFQEIVYRAGLDPFGMEGAVKLGAKSVPRMARRFPELFFIHVLAGEVPIDRVQRKMLLRPDLHPLFRRVMQIHVTEEARHVSFAGAYLREHVGELDWFHRLYLRWAAPTVLQQTAKAMLEPPKRLVDAYAIPKPVMRAAYDENPAHREDLTASVAPIRALAEDLGLVTRRTSVLWKRLGIWS
jgi:para-aminobenzoate N-oxygenase AurF